jgi:uncharacterized protein (DUF2236 family)
MSDVGYFPRGSSMLRRVQEERLVGAFYGQRALCIGALMPLNYVGTSLHTKAKQTPFRRLAHTANWFEAVMLGSREEADRVLEHVHRMHSRVHGELPEAAGPYPAGARYDAFDPELMLWTVAVMMDSSEHFYELFERRLRSAEREALWQDYIRFAELFGMPREAAPPTYPEFRSYYDGKLAGDELWLTDEARRVGYFTAFEIPFPRRLKAFKAGHDLVMLGSLPARVRRAYGLRSPAAHAAARRTAVTAMRTGRIVAPVSLTRGSCTWLFDGVASTEAHRIAHGRPTPQVGDEFPGRPPSELAHTNS